MMEIAPLPWPITKTKKEKKRKRYQIGQKDVMLVRKETRYQKKIPDRNQKPKRYEIDPKRYQKPNKTPDWWKREVMGMAPPPMAYHQNQTNESKRYQIGQKISQLGQTRYQIPKEIPDQNQNTKKYQIGRKRYQKPKKYQIGGSER